MAGFEGGRANHLAGGEATGDRFVILQGLSALAHTCQLRGDVAGSLPVLDRAIAIAREDGKLYRTSYLLAQSAYSLGLLGRLDDARARLADGQATNPDYRTTVLLDYGMQLDWLAGNLDVCCTTFSDQLAWTGGHSRRRGLGTCVAAISAAELADAAAARKSAGWGGGRRGCGRRGHPPPERPAALGGGVSAWLRGDAPQAVEQFSAAGRRQREGGWAAGPFGRLIAADLAEVAARTADPPRPGRSTSSWPAWTSRPRTGPGRRHPGRPGRRSPGPRGIWTKASWSGSKRQRGGTGFGRGGAPLLTQGRALALYGRAEEAARAGGTVPWT